MKLVKSILLAAPATIIAVAAAQAADLPSREAAPIEYVRICDAYGSGFFFIPGTNTCLRVGGYVRAEYQYTPGQRTINPTTGAVAQAAANQDTTGTEVRGRIDLDARTQTQWGTVQTVVWMRGSSVDGIKALGTTTATQAAAPTGVYASAAGATSVTLERAFIRFAGITAGIGTENFASLPNYMYAGFFAIFPSGIKQLAYTATFGGGFSSTIAIESRSDTPNSMGPAQYTYVNQTDTTYNLVGNVRYDSAWGYLQLSGAAANNTTRDNLTTAPNSVLNTNLVTNSALVGPSELGAFAVGGTADFKLPMIAAGDEFAVGVAYGHGMLGLVGCQDSTSACDDAANRRWLGGVLRVDQNLIATGLNTAGDVTFGTTNTWTIGASLTHYWAPTWRSNFAVQYERFDTPTSNLSVGPQLGNANDVTLGGSLIWSPVLNFDIGVEIDYEHLTQALQNPTVAFVAAGSPGLSEGNWTGRLRLQRQF